MVSFGFGGIVKEESYIAKLLESVMPEDLLAKMIDLGI
jgi:hypothetical protein